MGRIIKSLLVLALVSMVTSEKSYKNYSVTRTQDLNADQVSILRKLLESEKYDFWRQPRVGKPADIMASSYDTLMLEDFLNRKHIAHNTIIKNVQDLIEATRPKTKSQSNKLSFTEYNSYSDITQYLDELESKHDFVQVNSIGQSYEGRSTKVIHINKAGSGKPTVWIEAGVHAREWVSPAVALHIINQLVEGDDSTADEFNFYIAPSVNPDGYEFSRTSERTWRKSRSETGSALGCKGVDINRNFGFHFGESGVSSNKCSDIYNGPEAFSEVESRNLRDFIKSLDETPIFAICLHSFSQLWMYPFGYAYDAYPENVEAQRKVGEKAVNAIYNTHGKVYENINSADLYPASGAADDYYAGVIEVPFTVTLELRDTGFYGFMLPEAQIQPTAEEAWAGIKAALKQISVS